MSIDSATPKGAAFLQEIGEHPDDDGLRLVYADWLDDTGDADRGEFIRLQIELAGMPQDHPQRTDREKRAQVLLDAHVDEWNAPLAPLVERGVTNIVYRRGFPDTAQIPEGEEIRALAQQLCPTLRPALPLLQELDRSPTTDYLIHEIRRGVLQLINQGYKAQDWLQRIEERWRAQTLQSARAQIDSGDSIAYSSSVGGAMLIALGQPSAEATHIVVDAMERLADQQLEEFEAYARGERDPVPDWLLRETREAILAAEGAGVAEDRVAVLRRRLGAAMPAFHGRVARDMARRRLTEAQNALEGNSPIYFAMWHRDAEQVRDLIAFARQHHADPSVIAEAEHDLRDLRSLLHTTELRRHLDECMTQVGARDRYALEGGLQSLERQWTAMRAAETFDEQLEIDFAAYRAAAFLRVAELLIEEYRAYHEEHPDHVRGMGALLQVLYKAKAHGADPHRWAAAMQQCHDIAAQLLKREW